MEHMLADRYPWWLVARRYPIDTSIYIELMFVLFSSIIFHALAALFHAWVPWLSIALLGAGVVLVVFMCEVGFSLSEFGRRLRGFLVGGAPNRLTICMFHSGLSVVFVWGAWR